MTAPEQVRIVPNQYHLSGHGLAVSYIPGGAGPIVRGRGATSLTYQDATRSLSFGTDEVRAVDVPDVGTVVSVTIVSTVDVGDTTFSLLVPPVVLSAQDEKGTPIETDGITSLHRTFVRLIGHPQHVTYTVTHLHGTASIGILPD